MTTNQIDQDLTEDRLFMNITSCADYILYNDIQNDGTFEVQYDNGKFNGEINYCSDTTKEPQEWVSVKQRRVFKMIRDKATKDYSVLVNKTIPDSLL